MALVLTEKNAPSMLLAAKKELEGRAQRAEKKAKAEGCLRDFIEQAWHVVEPSTPFTGGWNIDAVCEHLEGVSAGHIRNLVLNVPPRTAKSLIVSVFWPAWEWIKRPEIRWLFSAYTSKLSLRDSMKCRRVIESNWYKANWGEIYHLIGDQNTKENYENNKTGQRIATSVSGIGVGAGGDRIVCVSGDTLVETDCGPLRIEQIVELELRVKVLGSEGFQRIQAYHKSLGSPMLEVVTEDGSSFRCTDNHPIWVENKGYISASEVLELTHADEPVFLRALREAVSPESEACSQVQTPVLFGEVPSHMAARGAESFVGRRQRDGGMPSLQGIDSLQAVRGASPDLLFEDVQGRLWEGKAAHGLRCLRDFICRVLGIEPSVLFDQVREYWARFKNSWRPEWPLHQWQVADGLLGGFYQDRQEYSFGAGRVEVRDVRSSGDGEAVACASRGRREDGSQSDESGQSLRILPSSSARGNQPRVDGAVRLRSIRRCEPSSVVYNLGVSGPHDYYANGILTHNCDDPNNTEEIESDLMRQGVLDWWDHTMSTRGNDPKTVARVVIQQRLHEQDLSGHVLAQGGYTHLFLPMRNEVSRRCRTVIAGKIWEDPRTKPGELLWPERFGDKEITELETRLGSYMAAGQLQQNPAPVGGGILKSQWWKYWQPRGANLPPVSVAMPDGSAVLVKPIDLPDKFDMVLQSWDMTFKDLDTSDFVVGGALAAKGASRYMLDLARGQWDLPKTLTAVRNFSRLHPAAYMKLVEDKANGPAVIQSLHHEIGGFIAVQPIGGKIARAAAGAPEVEAGNWYLPHPLIADWVNGFIAECAGFPKASHDDQVDMWSQGAARLRHVKPVDDEDTTMTRRIQARQEGGWSA